MNAPRCPVALAAPQFDTDAIQPTAPVGDDCSQMPCGNVSRRPLAQYTSTTADSPCWRLLEDVLSLAHPIVKSSWFGTSTASCSFPFLFRSSFPRTRWILKSSLPLSCCFSYREQFPFLFRSSHVFPFLFDSHLLLPSKTAIFETLGVSDSKANRVSYWPL